MTDSASTSGGVRLGTTAEADEIERLEVDIDRLTVLRDAVQRMVEDGHPCGSQASDEWFQIMVRHLAATEHFDEKATP